MFYMFYIIYKISSWEVKKAISNVLQCSAEFRKLLWDYQITSQSLTFSEKCFTPYNLNLNETSQNCNKI